VPNALVDGFAKAIAGHEAKNKATGNDKAGAK
jgi:hypothetical protein